MFLKIVNGYEISEQDMKPVGLNIKEQDGIFFTDEKHILQYCGYGNKIIEIEVPEEEKIAEVRNGYKADKIIIKKVKELWNIESFEWLMGCGADLYENKEQVLCYAAKNGCLDIIKLTFDFGVDIHTYEDMALRLAADEDYVDVARFLLKSGANVHAIDDEALCLATEGGYLEMVDLLIRFGANIHANEEYALRIAVKNGYSDVVERLTKEGANIPANGKG